MEWAAKSVFGSRGVLLWLDIAFLVQADSYRGCRHLVSLTRIWVSSFICLCMSTCSGTSYRLVWPPCRPGDLCNKSLRYFAGSHIGCTFSLIAPFRSTALACVLYRLRLALSHKLAGMDTHGPKLEDTISYLYSTMSFCHIGQNSLDFDKICQIFCTTGVSGQKWPRCPRSGQK